MVNATCPQKTSFTGLQMKERDGIPNTRSPPQKRWGSSLHRCLCNISFALTVHRPLQIIVGCDNHLHPSMALAIHPIAICMLFSPTHHLLPKRLKEVDPMFTPQNRHLFPNDLKKLIHCSSRRTSSTSTSHNVPLAKSVWNDSFMARLRSSVHWSANMTFSLPSSQA